MGLASVAGEVSHHRSAEDDAEAVGDSHHSTGGDGLFEGLVFSDDDFGFGIDDSVGHVGGYRMIMRFVGWGGQC